MTAGAERRAALSQGENKLMELLRYYLGPTGIPNRLAVANEVLNPVRGIEDAGAASRNMLAPNVPFPERVASAGNMLSEVAGAVAPVAAGRFAGLTADDMARTATEAYTGISTMPTAVAGRDFAADEAGMFAGIGARNADLGALERAQKMAEGGTDREAIWNETGWFKGVDGKWRFEIDDSPRRVDIPGAAKDRDDKAFERASVYEEASRIKARAKNRGISIREAIESIEQELGKPVSQDAHVYAQTSDDLYSQSRLAELSEKAWPIDKYAEPFRIREVMQHPELQGAYPSVFNRPLQVGGEGLAEYKAAYKPDDDSFFVQKYMERDKDFSLGHELQHRIQEQEGFAQGGNRATTVMDKVEPVQKRLDELTKQGAFARWEEYYNGPEGFRANKSHNRAVRDYLAANPNDTAFKEVNRLSNEKNDWLEIGASDYNRLAGEVESRNVQARKDMTPQQRKSSPPWKTQDTPDDRQIVKMNAALQDLDRRSR